MNINLTIDEKEIEELVKEQFKETAHHEMFERQYGFATREWKNLMKEAVREIVKENADVIIEKAIVYAGEYIGKKGVAKFVEGLKND